MRARTTAAGLFCLALACLSATSAGAAGFTDRQGALHACVDKKTGALRLVHPGKRCRRGEKSVTFNQKGQPGLNGTSITARPRSSGPLTLSNTPQDDPLTARHWSQQADELDVAFVQLVFSNPSNCQDQISAGPPPIDFPATASGEIDLNGARLATFSALGVGLTPTPTQVIAPIFEPGAVTGQTLTVKAQDNCNTGGHIVLNSLTIDVAAMH
jgi:hypothetical protein